MISSLLDFQVLVFVHALLLFSVKSHENNSNAESINNGVESKRWAVLIAGSNYYYNYRHQADICHAYQTLRKGGLKDENIIVFMYDDIAYAIENPTPGIIINKPNGQDVYLGVPKDYTGEDVNVDNFFNVILGNKSGITGGSGKVVESGPNDNIFIYYADHGSPGLLGMPSGEVLAKDFIKVLEKKHKMKSYKKMVIYVEACESGSIFQGLLKNNLNIFAMTASNAKESSWATYCYSKDYDTCLGDLFSISWLEDSDLHDMSKESLEQQYKVVKRRTGCDKIDGSSHVQRFGTEKFIKDDLVSYIGTNPENENFTLTEFNSLPISTSNSIKQRDIRLLYLKRKIQKSQIGSKQRQEAEEKLVEEIRHRKKIDESITKILRLSVKQTNVLNLLTSTRETGQALVDDWDCFKNLVLSFKKHCGATFEYGLNYAGALANICNLGVDVKQTVSAIEQACSRV